MSMTWRVWVQYKRNIVGRVHKEERTGIPDGMEKDALLSLRQEIEAKYPNCKVVASGGSGRP